MGREGERENFLFISRDVFRTTQTEDRERVGVCWAREKGRAVEMVLTVVSSAVARFRINRGRLCERTKQKFSESHVPEVQTLQTSPCNLGPLRPPHQLYASSITNQLNCFRLIRSYSGHVAAEKRRRRCWATLNHWKREREGNVEQCFSSHDK